MEKELNVLSDYLKSFDSDISDRIKSIAGRYDDVPISMPDILQPAYKYIMYLRLMKGLEDPTFYAMKRKYMNSSPGIQEECRNELDKIINRDALNGRPSSAEIRREFERRLKELKNS